MIKEGGAIRGMMVTIILFSPFSNLVSKKKIELRFIKKQKVNFKEVLNRFVEEYPKTKALLSFAFDKTRIYGSLLPLKGDKVLLLDDEVHDGEIIKFYPSINGG